MLSKNPKWQIGSDTRKILMKDLVVAFLSTTQDGVMTLAKDFAIDNMLKRLIGKQG